MIKKKGGCPGLSGRDITRRWLDESTVGVRLFGRGGLNR